MKLNKKLLRKMILNEIKLLSEGFKKGEISAQDGKIVFGDFTYQVESSGFELPVKFLEVQEGGIVYVKVQTPYVPFMSDGKIKAGKITDDLDKLKSNLSRGKRFQFKMKDEKGKDVNLDFTVV